MKFSRPYIISTLALLLALAGPLRTPAAEDPTDPAAERTLAADAAVTVALCLEAGHVIVRGWSRGEVRARTDSAARIELRRADATTGPAPATRIEVLLAEVPEAAPQPGECGQAGDIELDVPRGSTVQLKGRDSDVEVRDVARVRVETASGNIDLRNIAQDSEATTGNGDIELAHAGGRVRLRTISGQVVVSDVEPRAAGADLIVKSVSGDITLTDVRHARVEAGTVSGDLSLTGQLARDGSYDLQTTSGDVTVTLPAASSFFLNAKAYFGGDIDTEFPIRLVSAGVRALAGGPAAAHPAPTEPKRHGATAGSNLAGSYGADSSGAATLNLASFSGSVRLRRLE